MAFDIRNVYVILLIYANTLLTLLPQSNGATGKSGLTSPIYLSKNLNDTTPDLENADITTSLEWYQLLLLQILASFIGFLLFCICCKCCIFIMAKAAPATSPLYQIEAQPAAHSPKA